MTNKAIPYYLIKIMLTAFRLLKGAYQSFSYDVLLNYPINILSVATMEEPKIYKLSADFSVRQDFTNEWICCFMTV